MLRFGNISEINPSTGYARVKFLDEDNLVSDWLQICVSGALLNKHAYTFGINEQVAVLMDDNGEEGVILGALYNDGTQPPSGISDKTDTVLFEDGTRVEYNRQSGKLTVNSVGSVEITAATEIKITAPVITVTGNLLVSGSISAGGGTMTMEGGNINVDGDLTAQGSLTASEVTAGTVSLTTHVHSGVTTGGGTSGPPTP